MRAVCTRNSISACVLNNRTTHRSCLLCVYVCVDASAVFVLLRTYLTRYTYCLFQHDDICMITIRCLAHCSI
jgi:hypothetical protein